MVNKKASSLFLAGGLLLLAGFALGKSLNENKIKSEHQPLITTSPEATTATQPTKVQNKRETFLVTKVIDGDTIQIVGGKTVRYIGIDATETGSKATQCFASEATVFNRNLVENKEVRLEKDVSETDKYGRLLRYVFIEDTFVNDYLVRQGYAYASSYPPDVRYQKQFLDAQTEARENNRGLWVACETKSLEP